MYRLVNQIYKTKEYHEFTKENNKRLSFFRERQKLAKEWSVGSVIELGCGTSPIFKDSFKVDIYPSDGVHVFDLNKKLPINRKFDTLLALDVIEHLYDTHTFLSECSRLAKKGSRIIISTGNVGWWKSRLKLMFGDGSFFEENSDIHLQFFTPKTLKNRLLDFGFTTKKIQPIGRMKLLNLFGEFMILAVKNTDETVIGKSWVDKQKTYGAE